MPNATRSAAALPPAAPLPDYAALRIEGAEQSFRRRLAGAPVPQALADGVKQAIEDSMAGNSKRAYRTAWAAWQAFASLHGFASMPAAPDAVAAYLVRRAEAGAGAATLRMASAAIAAAHRIAGEQSPTASPAVKQALKGLVRQQAGDGQRQAKPLTGEAVAAVRNSLN